MDQEQALYMLLLDRVQRAREMQIFIGAESELSAPGELTFTAQVLSRMLEQS
jgi:heat-inducible transcriptional repressor